MIQNEIPEAHLAAFIAWWSDLTRDGDPARMANLTLRAYSAGRSDAAPDAALKDAQIEAIADEHTGQCFDQPFGFDFEGLFAFARAIRAAAPQAATSELSDAPVTKARATLPQSVLDALRFYAHGHHYTIDDDCQDFDTVSGEPQNWLCSMRDDDRTMFEDGSIAKSVLLGGLSGFEEPSEPLDGEVFIAAASVTGSGA